MTRNLRSGGAKRTNRLIPVGSVESPFASGLMRRTVVLRLNGPQEY